MVGTVSLLTLLFFGIVQYTATLMVIWIMVALVAGPVKHVWKIMTGS